MVDPTTNSPSDPKLTGLPATVIGDPPGNSVVPLTTRFDNEPSLVKVSPPTVITAPLLLLVLRGGRLVVREPTTNSPSGAKLSVVPATTAAEPPPDRVFPSMRTLEEDSVKVRLPIAKTGSARLDDVEGMVLVEDPIINAAERPREITVPETVTALPLGRRVVSSIAKPVGFAVKRRPPPV